MKGDFFLWYVSAWIMWATGSSNLMFHTCLSFFRVSVGMCSGNTGISVVYERRKRSQRRSEAIGSVHLDMSDSCANRSGCRYLAVYKTSLLFTPQWSLFCFACFLPSLFHSSFHMFSYYIVILYHAHTHQKENNPNNNRKPWGKYSNSLELSLWQTYVLNGAHCSFAPIKFKTCMLSS